MDSELSNFLQLAKCAIYGENASPIIKEDVNWEQIFDLSRQHSMSAILYKTISQLPRELQPEPELLAIWKREAFQYGIMQLRQNQELASVISDMREQQIDLVPFKGILLARLYPEPLMRISGDSDLFVAEKEKERVISYLLERGYVIDEKETIDTVTVLCREGILTIELHTCLWEDYIGKRVRIMEKYQLTNPDSFISVKACGIECKTLGVNQHLIYQIYHMVKHFSLSGIGIRHLTDLTLYINNYIDQIDIHHFWNVMEEMNYTTCCNSFFQICIECFGMNPDIMKGCKQVTKIEIYHLIEDIIDGGVFGNASQERFHARNIIKPYLKNETQVEISKRKMILKIIFPGAEVVKEQYAYARKCPLLLPVAWIQRSIKLLSKQFGKNKSSYGEKTINQAKYRLQLLEELEIINKRKEECR